MATGASAMPPARLPDGRHNPAYPRARAALHRAQGLCIYCTRPALVPKAMCRECIARRSRRGATTTARRESLRRLRARRVHAGECINCGRMLTILDPYGQARCRVCGPRQRAANRTHMARLYADRKAAGVCGRCGGERDGPRAICAACRDHARREKARRKASGLCTTCGTEEPAPRRMSCAPCLARGRDRMRQVRAARRADAA